MSISEFLPRLPGTCENDMKALALALLFSLPVPKVAPTAQQAGHRDVLSKRSRKGGKWYFAANGHAVYCYGPVMYVTEAQGSLKRDGNLLPERPTNGRTERLVLGFFSALQKTIPTSRCKAWRLCFAFPEN